MSYHLILKTGDAELRAWRHLSEGRKSKITVHCEITRGRKKPNKDKSIPAEYNIGKVLSVIAEDFVECEACVVDITREPTLKSDETEALGSPDDGYSKWIETVLALKEKNSRICPTLIINPREGDSYEQFENDIFRQFDAMSSEFERICYRASVLFDDSFVDDIEMLSERINRYIEGGGIFEVLLDFEYIQPSTAALHASYSAPIIRSIRDFCPRVLVVCAGTSFPRNVTEIGDEESDEFRLEEIELLKEINRMHNDPVSYGDYGSINPIRNDFNPPVGVHLRARIDFPTEADTIFYQRIAPIVDKESGTLISSRSSMYKNAAKIIASSPKFSLVPESWGCEMILEAAERSPSGSSPSFWISVRMEIHISRRVDALFA
jgi:hypothetical protein